MAFWDDLPFLAALISVNVILMQARERRGRYSQYPQIHIQFPEQETPQPQQSPPQQNLQQLIQQLTSSPPPPPPQQQAPRPEQSPPQQRLQQQTPVKSGRSFSQNHMDEFMQAAFGSPFENP